MKHFTFGGSTAARTIACPSWHTEASKNPPRETSIHALEGTALHSCMEQIGDDAELQAYDFIGRTVDDVLITEDHAKLLDQALGAFESVCEKYEFDDFLNEVTVQMSDEIGGTTDILLYGKHTVCVLDWKFGHNRVHAKDNAQGMFYAMCARYEMPQIFETIDEIVIAIVQPKQLGAEADTWSITLDKLDEFQAAYIQATQKVGYNAGDHCRWCPGQATCPEVNNHARIAAAMNPQQLENLSEALGLAQMLEPWIKEVKNRAHEQLELGEHVSGWKLVEKRATRKWSDEDEVLDKLASLRRVKKDDYLDQKLKSPAQLEKVIDIGVLSDYIVKTSSGTTLAPESDPREEALSEGQLIAALKSIT